MQIGHRSLPKQSSSQRPSLPEILQADFVVWEYPLLQYSCSWDLWHKFHQALGARPQTQNILDVAVVRAESRSSIKHRDNGWGSRGK